MVNDQFVLMCGLIYTAVAIILVGGLSKGGVTIGVVGQTIGYLSRGVIVARCLLCDKSGWFLMTNEEGLCYSCT